MTARQPVVTSCYRRRSDGPSRDCPSLAPGRSTPLDHRRSDLDRYNGSLPNRGGSIQTVQLTQTTLTGKRATCVVSGEHQGFESFAADHVAGPAAGGLDAAHDLRRRFGHHARSGSGSYAGSRSHASSSGTRAGTARGPHGAERRRGRSSRPPSSVTSLVRGRAAARRRVHAVHTKSPPRGGCHGERSSRSPCGSGRSRPGSGSP